jgi:tetratricopeptide (TPR) repeat protein
LHGAAAQAQGTRTPTYGRDIAPILREHCVACHHPDGAAPFSLTTFADVRAKARLVTQTTRSRYMPPWKPQAGHGEFADARRLSDQQIALIARWVETGAGQGEPVSETAEANDRWEFGVPDLVVGMPAPYLLDADGGDVIRSFVIPVAAMRGRYVKALEFHPGNARVVHHANIKIDTSGSSRRLDAVDAAPGFDGSSRDARFPDGYFLGWTPGQRAHASAGNAWYLPGGADLVVELHLTPSGKAERVQASVGLFFTDEAPARMPYMIRLGSQRIDIPAGASAYVSRDRYALPVEVDLLAVQPHAHNLARSIKGYAQRPGGSREWLIDIPDWDFRWQDVYRFATPVHLPKGTVLEMEYTYDNSDNNPRNPHRPPRRVTFGQTSSAEMGDLWLQVVTATAGERATLDRDYAPKMLKEDTAGDETALLLRPNDALLRRDLAQCYLEAGRIDDAIRQFERALAFESTAESHYELGIVLLKANQLDAAATHLQRALELKPDDAASVNSLGVVAYLRGNYDEAIRSFERSLTLQESALAHFNLGRTLARMHRRDEAKRQYEIAIALKPDDADARVGLGAVLVESGQPSAAIAQYREALRLNPDLPSALTDLAWILATASDSSLRQPLEAIRLAETADRLTSSKNAVILETLAVSYFAAGRSDEAVRALRKAIDRAVADGDESTSQRLRDRLASFERPR